MFCKYVCDSIMYFLIENCNCILVRKTYNLHMNVTHHIERKRKKETNFKQKQIKNNWEIYCMVWCMEFLCTSKQM